MHRPVNGAATGAACLLMAASSTAQAPRWSGDEIRVNRQTQGIQQSAAVAIDAQGSFVVAWQSEVPGRGDEIRARRFDACGVPLSDEISVNVVTAGHQNAPTVALAAGGRFVVAWQTVIENDLQIRARAFGSQGRAEGGEIAVNAISGNTSSAPEIGMDGRGNFILTWESSINGSYEIRARRFGAQGDAQGGEIAVNAETMSAQRGPALAVAPEGDFVTVWRSNVDGSNEIRARRFDAAGVPRGDELHVNTTHAGEQVAPDVALAADGRFVVAWESFHDGRYEVRARRFEADGAATADELVIQPGAGARQFAPAIAAGPNGGFLVVWQSFTPGHLEVRARAFAETGAASSDELGVNTVSSGTQKSPALALSAQGELVTAWHSDAGGNWDVSARKGTWLRQPGAPGVGSSEPAATSKKCSTYPAR